jgi:hypothetical protein
MNESQISVWKVAGVVAMNLQSHVVRTFNAAQVCRSYPLASVRLTLLVSGRVGLRQLDDSVILLRVGKPNRKTAGSSGGLIAQLLGRDCHSA